MVSNIRKIFLSEFINILTDKGTQLISVFAIFLYSLFYLIPFHNDILRDVPVGIVDNDNTKLSREIIRDFDANEMIKVVSKPINLEDAKNQFYKDKIKGFIVIPKDFEHDIKRGNPSTIAAYTDSAYLIIYKQLATGISSVTQGVGAQLEIGSLMKKGISKEAALCMKFPFELISIPLYNPVGSYQNYMYPLILIMILQQTMLLGITITGGTDVEKLKGLTYRNRKNEVVTVKNTKINLFSDKPYEIVLGKGIAYVALYFLYSMMYFLIFPVFGCYKMTYNIIPMLILVVTFLFATAFLGQALIFIFRTRESSLFVLIASSVPFIFLPGFVWPREAIPHFLNALALFIPFTSASRGLVKINQTGAGFSGAAEDFIILVILCILYYLISCLSIKHLQE